ncbi:efflux RND transporter periplasmic adaptor subunit [Falsigemmobacter faecalis]|uniref:HlyD family efflux transporter periplasmic adaptor subunit n=1 Tax=Falsigemmobacter faecalis TaxID=2488730 RepID=A0A3P3DHV9_9RHOB|nr:hypothetical protein [Falsigemmobacter faecalis]RRH73847.1 hypothetical protein EG244_12315 [Falsigemmobacter faecalis]
MLRIFGEAPPAEVHAALAALRLERPAAQKIPRGLALSVPLAGGQWCVWCLEGALPLSGLGPLMTRAQALTGGLMAAGAATAAAKSDPGELAALAQALKAPLKKPALLAGFLGEHLVGRGQASGLVVFTLKKGRVKTLLTSDTALSRVQDLLKNLITAVLAGGEVTSPRRFDVATESQDAPGPEAALILQRLGFARMDLHLPEKAQDGWGALIFEPAEEPAGFAATVPALMQVMHPLSRKTEARGLWRFLRPAALVAGAALLLALAWPVPEKITLTGTAEPENAKVAALSSDAVLEAMLVRVGDLVGEGQPVARFRSVQLAEAAAQERLNIAVEDLNAQGAMAKNDYGAVQLHESRRRLSEARLADTEARIARLTVTAPAAGRVVGALPPHVTGGSFPTGREVVRVQTGQDFLMELMPSNVDARRLRVGMTGLAMFRGLTDREYAIEVISPPALVRDPQSGRDTLQLVARLSDPDDRLLAGLSGYARLEGETRPRLLGLSHYLIEYVRTRIWTYLGLHL